MDLMLLDVPYYFFKNEPFYCEPDEIRKFYENLTHVVEGNIVIPIEVNIEETIEHHSGDCRIWNGTYDILSGKQFIMKVSESGYYDDIYDWMEMHIPSLYKRHKDYDKTNRR